MKGGLTESVLDAPPTGESQKWPIASVGKWQPEVPKRTVDSLHNES